MTGNGFIIPERGRRKLRVPWKLLVCLLSICAALFAAVHLLNRFLDTGSGWIGVYSQPAGAAVFLNGRLTGATPVRITDLPVGNYSVRLEKDGHHTVLRPIRLRRGGVELREELQALPVARLRVAVEPAGAEVLLDGELLGTTPLFLPSVPSGPHELVVRKTNFVPWRQHVTLRPGETTEFAGLVLENAILRMLRERLQVEPWRVGHFTELGHYLFVNDRQVEAAETLIQAMLVGKRPIEFVPEMQAEDRAAEKKLREDDLKRLLGTIQRMTDWTGKNTATFRARMEQPDALLAMLGLRLHLGEFNRAVGTAKQILDHKGVEPKTLAEAARAIAATEATWAAPERPELRMLVPKLLQAACAAEPSAELRAEYAAELYAVLRRQDNPDEASRLRQEALAAAEPGAQETYALSFAAALANLKHYDLARELYQRLLRSARPEIRSQAQKALSALPPPPK